MIKVVVDTTYLGHLFGHLEEAITRLYNFPLYEVAQADLADITVYDLLEKLSTQFRKSLSNDVIEHLCSEILDIAKNHYCLSDFEATDSDAAGWLVIHDVLPHGSSGGNPVFGSTVTK